MVQGGAGGRDILSVAVEWHQGSMTSIQRWPRMLALAATRVQCGGGWWQCWAPSWYSFVLRLSTSTCRRWHVPCAFMVFPVYEASELHHCWPWETGWGGKWGKWKVHSIGQMSMLCSWTYWRLLGTPRIMEQEDCKEGERIHMAHTVD